MKSVFLVLIIGCFAAAGFWYITEITRADRDKAEAKEAERALRNAEKAREQEIADKEEAARNRAEEERLRKERAEALAKEDAVRLFLAYIDREEERIKDEIEEYKIEQESIGVDRESLSDELRAIERANAARVKSTTKRGEQQRDKVEKVRAMLHSPVLNRLARKYLSEDFAALASKFEAEMQKIKDVDDRFHGKLRQNLQQYEESVADADVIVNKKLKAARAKYDSFVKNTDKNRVPKLKEQLAQIEREIERIVTKKTQLSRWDEQKLERLRQQEVLVQNQLAQFEDISGLSSANIAHMEATEAETEARRKFDKAGKTLTMANDQALLERDYEQDIYNLVIRFENASLDKIRQGMTAHEAYTSESLTKAKRRLDYMKSSANNLDFLSAKEIEALRQKLAQKVSEKVMFGE